MEPLKIPRFARDLFALGRMRCRGCSKNLMEQHVTFCGAGRDKDESICFSFELKCPYCNRINTIMDTTHQFTDAQWWTELGLWHEEALVERGPFDRSPWKKGRIFALVGPPPLKSVEIIHGYAGDVGPVILRVYGSLFENGHGVVRLERNDQVRLIHGETDESLSAEKWSRFKKVPENTVFGHRGREWKKLTRAFIQDIVCDRVFTVTGPKTVHLPNPPSPSKAKQPASRKARLKAGPDKPSH